MDERNPKSAPNLSKLPNPPVITINDVPREPYRVGAPRLAMQFAAFSVVAIIFISLALLSYPLFNEGVSNECSAFEANALMVESQNMGNENNQHTNALVIGPGNLLRRASNGAVASDVIKIKYPNIPAPISCAVGYYQLSLNPKGWKSFIATLITNSSEAKKQNSSDAMARLSIPKKIRQRAPTYARQTDNAPTASLNLSANDLALGFDKLRWGMSIKDATTLYPALNGEPIQPLQVLATLSLDNYVYTKCAFAVHLDFENAKLTRVELESDATGTNFKACHTQTVAELVKRYGEEQGGISPVSPYHGYSLHGEWRGPITDVVLNELQNTVIEINFSPTNVAP